jgi:hypothetical protein
MFNIKQRAIFDAVFNVGSGISVLLLSIENYESFIKTIIFRKQQNSNRMNNVYCNFIC